ncbi:hypothetical protein HK28_13555 [Acetobacter sp. DsW_063]|nr:hypothetical protein HK28_13555 [Acetobacter sp. DsW_063]
MERSYNDDVPRLFHRSWLWRRGVFEDEMVMPRLWRGGFRCDFCFFGGKILIVGDLSIVAVFASQNDFPINWKNIKITF